MKLYFSVAKQKLFFQLGFDRARSLADANIFIRVAAVFPLLFLFVTFVLSSVVFLFHASLCGWIPAVALLFSVSFCAVLLSRQGVAVWKNCLFGGVVVIAFLLAIYLMGLFYDYSWDGQTYHQSSIYLMKNGWNPVYENCYDFLKARNWSRLLGGMWDNVYVKFMEISAANLYLLTGNIQSGKAVLIFLAWSGLLEGILLFREWKISRIFAVLLSIALCLNPIALAQLLTFYVDGGLYFAFLLLVFYLLRLEDERNDTFGLYAKIVMAALILSNIKLLGFFYAGLILGGYWISVLVRRRKGPAKKLVLACLVLLGLCVLTGANPYGTNLQRGFHIFHPFMGRHKKDIMTHNTPGELRYANTAERLFLSMFSRTAHGYFAKPRPGSKEPKVVLKWPFTLKGDIPLNYATRLGGFGWFGSGVFVLGGVIFILGFFFRSENKRKILLLWGLVLLSVLANPESWWARYVPQFWILPCLAAVLVAPAADEKKLRYFRYGTVLLFLGAVSLNSLFILQQLRTEERVTFRRARRRMARACPGSKVVIYHELSAHYYSLLDDGIVCDPCSPDDIPKLLKSGYVDALGTKIYFIKPRTPEAKTAPPPGAPKKR